MNFTRANLAAAERETRASGELRQLIGHVLQDTSEDLRTQCARVDEAFNQRCRELTEAKVQLEIHLSQVSTAHPLPSYLPPQSEGEPMTLFLSISPLRLHLFTCYD